MNLNGLCKVGSMYRCKGVDVHVRATLLRERKRKRVERSI